MDQLAQKQAEILGILKNPTLTHEQTMMQLAKAAENLLDTPGIPAEFLPMLEDGMICDLGEGHAPYAPRYICPDYSVLMEKGSQFLRLDAPKNLLDATNALLILYHHVPSVTHFPVYIGRLDELLEPFVAAEDPAFAKQVIKNFLRQIDRTVTDSFCHGNIGPRDTKAGRIILACERELQNSTPNITLLYDPAITPDDFATLCCETALDCAKPSFANDAMFRAEFNEEYAIASCYNGLPIRGGAFTLTRLKLGRMAEKATSKADFLENVLPHTVEVMLGFMDAKIKFLLEETPFFRVNFLVREGFLSADRFNGLFGLVGMNECVNSLMDYEGKPGRFGHDEEADKLGVLIMEKIKAMVDAHENKNCPYWKNHFMLHAQVGMDSDSGSSPGTRIAIGHEIPLYDHLRQAGLFHHFFPSGTGDIFPFDSTSARNPAAILDIIKGSFKVGIRYFSTYSTDSDVIRITGYLVKKSDIAKLEQAQPVVNDTVVLGMGAAHNSHILERKVRTL